ncbi:MAG TPA: hypothetical protein VFG50_01260 [Rhodothermales bacterium]|nr:hypothetical protein [Rhodothermales bacterium]
MSIHIESLNRLIRVVLLSGLVLYLGLAFGQGYAQSVRTLSVQAGKVYIDGQQVSPDQLPGTFDPANLTLQFRFVGEADPVVEVGGRLYRLEGQKLVEVDPATDTQFQALPFASGFDRAFTMPEPQMQTFTFHFEPLTPHPDVSAASLGQEVLQEQARELQNLSMRLEEARLSEGVPTFGLHSVTLGEGTGLQYPGPDLDELRFITLPEILRMQAARAAQAARQLPKIEVRSYLHDVRASDAALYDRLVQEQQLEQESLALAARVRSLGRGPERTQREAELRARLEQIFRLKQENRRREIEELEGQLDDLQQRLDQREQLHGQIVEKRLRELVGSGTPNE